MWIGIVTLFPKMFQAITNYGITSRAHKKGFLDIHYWNPRDFTKDKYRTVDDHPYGGGSGMLMMFPPLREAIQAAKSSKIPAPQVLYLSPQGRPLDQSGVNELAKKKNIILVCGRYQGIDERILQYDIDEEWSVGDYILSGGELAAMILIDALCRLIPGVLGSINSVREESFVRGLLEYPHYTRPQIFQGIKVPNLLLSGNHHKIYRWRLKQSLGRTWIRRPDLLAKVSLNKDEEQLLEEFQHEWMNNK
ncbi:MAG: tRNA (guanosine(37)-N1)-methyltransferase TrmD [Candidatus Dasytiphilus stammeri]